MLLTGEAVESRKLFVALHRYKQFFVMGKIKYTTGSTFHNFVIIGENGKYLGLDRKQKKKIFVCKCVCGNTKNIISSNIYKAVSCGCLKRKVNVIKTSTHGIWANMKSRCNNPKSNFYKNYGGRGITYDKWWEKFENFLEDMGERPEKLTLDRINSNGNYCKENCKWSTQKEQQNNRTNNHLITYNGETKTLQQWSEVIGIHPSTISYRIKKYNSVKLAFTLKNYEIFSVRKANNP